MPIVAAVRAELLAGPLQKPKAVLWIRAIF